jgi:hypothetical protein
MHSGSRASRTMRGSLGWLTFRHLGRRLTKHPDLGRREGRDSSSAPRCRRPAAGFRGLDRERDLAQAFQPLQRATQRLLAGYTVGEFELLAGFRGELEAVMAELAAAQREPPEQSSPAALSTRATMLSPGASSVIFRGRAEPQSVVRPAASRPGRSPHRYYPSRMNKTKSQLRNLIPSLAEQVAWPVRLTLSCLSIT